LEALRCLREALRRFGEALILLEALRRLREALRSLGEALRLLEALRCLREALRRLGETFDFIIILTNLCSAGVNFIFIIIQKNKK
jgi:hypothetical protein